MADWWDNRPWRQIQTNLREIDMLDMDAERFASDLRAFKANSVMFNAAGIIASYPTKLPFHFQSPYLKGDSMADVIAACHASGIMVTARTDFSKVRRPIYEMHPDWAYRTADGDIVDYNGDVHCCINGDYWRIYAPQIMEELLTTHDLDGIFFNAGGYQTRDYSRNYYGVCHCASCQEEFEEMFGLPLPRVEDTDDPVYRKYMVFKRRTLAAHQKRVTEFLWNIRPELLIANQRDTKRSINRQESGSSVDRPLPHWQYHGSSNTKWAVSSYPGMVSSNTTNDFIDIPYRHSAVSPYQQELRLAQNLANGGGLDYYLMGRLDNHEDKSGYERIKRVFHYHAANEQDYLGLTSKANVALVGSTRTSGLEFNGWYRFLVENHFLFDTPIEDAVMDVPWAKYEAIILPDTRFISDALAAKLDAFVSGGGTLIASGMAGFYDEDYELRDAPAIKSLGIEEVELVKENMRSAYFKFDDKTGFDRFPLTDIFYLDGPYVYAKYAETAEQRLKLIPPHNFGPPERCYYEVVVDRPALVVNPFGKGKAIYVPWLPGELFHRQGHTNTADFAADLLENVAGIAPVGGNLSPMVEVTLFEQESSGAQLVHLVNGSGHFGTTFYAPVPMYELVAEVPCASQPASTVSLVTKKDVPVQFGDGTLSVNVASLGLFEAVKLTW